jgi:methylthioribose-1-phosphate isomerase
MDVEGFFDKVSTVRMTADRSALDIIDQTLLPNTVKRIKLRTKEEIWDAIKRLRVRGAPAIGVTAAYGIALLASGIKENSFDAFSAEFASLKDYLASSRPTAVNLFWALNRMDGVVQSSHALPVSQIKEKLFSEAEKIRDEDVRISRSIGEIGFDLLAHLKKPNEAIGIMTHCNAGTLATAKYGTATAPMYIALERGWAGTDMHVFCDETRPLLQGARLTAFELHNAGITTTLQCDNMASLLMKSGKIAAIVWRKTEMPRTRSARLAWQSSPSIMASHFMCVPRARPLTLPPPRAIRSPSRCVIRTKSRKCGTGSAWHRRASMSSTQPSTSPTTN